MGTTDIACTAWHLTYVAGGSDKFYEIIISESGLCILRWGRNGSTGQKSVTTFPTYEQALDQGRKQLYAKRSKGYSEKWNFKFLATRDVLDEAKRENVQPLRRTLLDARSNGEWAGAKETVLKHYDDLAKSVREMLELAPSQDFEEAMQEYEALEKVWNEITERHGEVATAMSLAKATVTSKLMGV